MDSLADILKTRKLKAPDELEVIRKYIIATYDADCTVTSQHGKIILKLPGSALAATVQLERQQLIKTCNLGDKQLIVRSGV